MIRAIVIADSGPAMAALTGTLARIDEVEIVRHVSGRSNATGIVHRFSPDLVLVEEMHWPPRALARVSEAHAAAPSAAVVVVAERIEGGWLADALRLGAAAVLPAHADPGTFRRVIHEALTVSPAAA